MARIGLSAITAALILGSAALYAFKNRVEDSETSPEGSPGPAAFSQVAGDEIITSPPPPDLVEQRVESEEERFEVVGTELGEDGKSYRLAFKLGNNTDRDRDFHLIPVFHPDQASFAGIKGNLEGGTARWDFDAGWSFDKERHKQELVPELAEAYDEIEKGGYAGRPVKLTLDARTSLTAQAEWQMKAGPGEALEPVYFLVEGSAGGAKDDLDILNVYSHPLAGDDWVVYFTTRVPGDLTITPADQRTVDDLAFESVGCSPSSKSLEEAVGAEDFEEGMPEILDGDVISHPGWSCAGVGRLVHHVNTAGKHTLRFDFNGETDYAYNSNLYWVGPQNGNVSDAANWNTTDPAGCNPGGRGDATAPPGATDVAIFDADCDKNATINANWSVAGINMNSGYTGTVTQNNGVTLTVGTSDFIQDAGTFTGGNSTITFNDAFSQSGGTFTASSGTTSFAGGVTVSGGTFNHNSGTIQATGGTATWDVNGTLTVNNFTLNKTGGKILVITTGDTVIVEGTFTHTDGVVNTGTIQAEGDVVVAAGADGGTGTLTFSGSNSQTYTDNGGNEMNGDVTVDKSGGSVTLASNADWNAASQDVTIAEGTLDLSGYTLATNVFTVQSGGTLKLQGGETVTTSTLNLNSGSAVVYTGAGSAVTVKDWAYKTLTFNGAGKQFNWTAGTTYTVSENFKVVGAFGSDAVFRSTVTDTTWGINNTGANEDVRYADVQDSVATEEIIVVGGKDSGNNTNWTWLTNEPLRIKGGPLRFKGGYRIK